MKFDRQLRLETENSWVVSYGGKTIPWWGTAAILKIDISPYLSEKSSNFHEILYTAADFELDERHVIKNEKVALDRLWVRQNIFLVIIIIIKDERHSNIIINRFQNCGHSKKLLEKWMILMLCTSAFHNVTVLAPKNITLEPAYVPFGGGNCEVNLELPYCLNNLEGPSYATTQTAEPGISFTYFSTYP